MQTVADWLGHLWRHTRKRSQAQLVQLIRQHWLLLTDALILMDDHVCVCVSAHLCVCVRCVVRCTLSSIYCARWLAIHSQTEKERGIERVAIWMLSPWRIYQMFFSSFLYRVNQKISKNHFVRKREWGKKGLGRGPQWNWFYFRLALNLPAMWVTFWFFFFILFIATMWQHSLVLVICMATTQAHREWCKTNAKICQNNNKNNNSNNNNKSGKQLKSFAATFTTLNVINECVFGCVCLCISRADRAQ